MHKNEIRTLSQQRCRTGENPLWHAEERRLYWVDIPRGRLYRFDPERGQTQTIREGDDGTWIGGFTIQSDGNLLFFLNDGRVERWNGVTGDPVAKLECGLNMRFNDVIADPAGRVFCGTVSYPEVGVPGGLYRLDPDGGFTQVVDDVLCANGMGFTNDQKYMYFTDSNRRTTWRFDYDVATGELNNRQVWLLSREEDGLPDGLIVDAEDHVWTAHWDGGCVIRYTPQGVEERRIMLPTQKIASLTFGCAGLDMLYLTAAGGDAPVSEDPLAGALFGVNPGVKGKAEFLSRIACSGS